MESPKSCGISYQSGLGALRISAGLAVVPKEKEWRDCAVRLLEMVRAYRALRMQLTGLKVELGRLS